ncbi:MAG: hypothetical protein IPJ30_14120 [Acidobacteria bacterium]|nr:hypothetical protein [Acidobacteriota bacterium]
MTRSNWFQTRSSIWSCCCWRSRRTKRTRLDVAKTRRRHGLYARPRDAINPVVHYRIRSDAAAADHRLSFSARSGGALASIPPIAAGRSRTPVNPRNWTKYNQANVMVSIAGILANIILAVSPFAIFKLLLSYDVLTFASIQEGAEDLRYFADL